MPFLSKRSVPTAILLGAVSLVFVACGSTELPNPTASNPNGPDQKPNNTIDATVANGPLIGEAVRPEEGYYTAILERKFSLISASTEKLASSSQKILYVNFDGAAVKLGNGRGESFLLCSDEGIVPASNLAKSDQSEVLKLIKGFFDGAKINLTITSTRPSSSSEYTVIHVGGTADDLGCSNDDGFLGKSPLDLGNSNGNDVAFVYETPGATNHQLAVAIANQAGHTFGLDSVQEDGSVMALHYSPNITGFGKGKQASDDESVDHVRQLQTNLSPSATKVKLLALAGTTATASNSGLSQLPAELARLTGIDVIAALGALLNDFKSGQPMDISKILAQIDATVPGGLNNAQNIGGLQGIEDLLSVIVLSAEAAAKQSGGTVQSTGVESLLKVFLDPSKLKAQDLLSIAGLAAQIGIAAATGGAGAAVVAAINLIIGGLQGATPPPANSPTLALAKNPSLPKFDELLGVESIEGFQSLVANLEAHATIVNSNFRGNSRQALLTMLKLGYSQVFNRLAAQGLD